MQLLVDGLLLARAGDALAEVALWVEEADAHEGQAQIAGLLAVVAGEDAQAARVDRQRLVQPELRGEVGDGAAGDRKSTRLNSSHMSISYAVFCLKKKK